MPLVPGLRHGLSSWVCTATQQLGMHSMLSQTVTYCSYNYDSEVHSDVADRYPDDKVVKLNEPRHCK